MRILTSTERWCAETDTWSAGVALDTKMIGRRVVVLDDGSMVLIGGFLHDTYNDVVVGRGDDWVNGPPLVRHRYLTGVALLRTGCILAVGGLQMTPGRGGLTALRSVEQRGRDGVWHEVALLPIPVAEVALAQLDDDAVLVTGGYDDELSDRCFVYRDGRCTETAVMSTRRAGHTATTLPDGRVVVVGGKSSWEGHAIEYGEIWDPKSGGWTPFDGMLHPRVGHTATLLHDGRLFVCGGMSASHARQTAELLSF